MRRHLKLGALLLSLVGVLTFSVAGLATPKAPAPGGSAHGSAHGTAADHGGGHDDHGNAPKPSVNWVDVFNKEKPAYIALVVNLAVLLAIYYKFGKKPVSEGLAARSEAIAKDIREAQELLTKAEQRGQMYGAKLAALESDKASVQSTLTETGKGEKERIEREAAEKADRLQRDAEFLVEQEKKQLRQDVLKETALAAVAEAEALLRKNITPQDQERIAEEYLADLGKADLGRIGGVA